jgi:hypothetical protein
MSPLHISVFAFVGASPPSHSMALLRRRDSVDTLHGNIEDLGSLRREAADSDGVIHLAFSHDFSQFEKNAADERKAIAALGEVLLGSDRPFVVTSGTAMAADLDNMDYTQA